MLLFRLRPLCLAATAAWPVAAAVAQPVAPAAPAASGTSVELTPAERAKRDAEKVFHWILIQGNKARKPAVSRDDKPDKATARVKSPVRAPARPDEPVSASPKVTEAVAGAAPAASAPSAAPETVAAPVEPVADVTDEAPVPAVATVEAPTLDDPTEPLTPLAQPEPRFPSNLLRTLRSGQVQVRFTVLPDGSVAEPVVVTSSNPKLNPSALAAVAQWRFAPLRKPQQGFVDLGFNNAE
jgi:TonB family protein